MKEIYLLISNKVDRERIILSLINNGYKVRLEKERENLYKMKYWIIFEVPDMNVKDK